MNRDPELSKKLLQSKIFHSLTFSEIDSFLSLSKNIKLRNNEFLLKQGEHGEDFFWVETGSLEVSLEIKKGYTFKLSTLLPGDVVGEMILLGKNLRTASVKASSDTSLLSWNCAECMKFFEKNPFFGFILLKNFSSVLADKIESMNTVLKNSQEKIDLKIFEALMVL